MRPVKPRTTEFGIYLADLREQQELTLEDLAFLAGLSTSYISQLETGRKNATPRAIRMISGALDIHPNQLLRLVGILAMPLEATLRARDQLEALNLEVTVEERTQLLAFLEFLRFKESIEIR